MDLVFWLSAALVVYVYAGYPALLAIAVRLARRRPRHRARLSAALPRVSVIVVARNEAARLPARIQNLLDSDYPRDRVQIIVASDGSTDDTARVLEPFGDRVQLLGLAPSGKAAALNAAVSVARHPILVFADARQRFAPDAIRRLVAHFADPGIGAVSGELVLDCERFAGDDDARPQDTSPRSTVADGIGAYWRYEKWLRRQEAYLDSTVGVTGAIYAMRRRLWHPLPADTLLDDVVAPMRVVVRGYRVVFEPAARAFDKASPTARTELRRKVRTLAGNVQLVVREPGLLVPGLNPVWLQFVSHKIGRLLVPYALLALVVASAWLAVRSTFYLAAFAGQLAFYALAAYGGLLERRAARRGRSADEVVHEAA